ncbi:MAG: TRAP transporter small permease [Pseudomonadota bacterium]
MLNRLTQALEWAENALLTLLLAALIGFAAYQVLARNLGSGGLLWGDALVRVLVFWITLVGAMVAARRDDHIRIDALTRFLPDSLRRWAARFAAAFTAGVCGLLTYYSFVFVRYEYEDGVLAFAEVPAWVCEAVLPLGAGVLTLRYALRVRRPL